MSATDDLGLSVILGATIAALIRSGQTLEDIQIMVESAMKASSAIPDPAFINALKAEVIRVTGADSNYSSKSEKP